MALTQEEIEKLRDEFSKCVRPVILFDSDHDGLSSFLMLYKHIKDGKGIPIKRSPDQWEELARKINDYSPDLIIIVDVPVIEQEFFDKITTKVIWIDHHPVLKLKKVEYYNPRIHDDKDNRPVSYWIYRILQENLWIGMCGMIGDWHMPEDEIRLEFVKKYPELLSEEIIRPQDALYNSKIGELIKVMNYNLKGKTTEVLKSIKVFTRIKSPQEIFNEETAGGKFLYKKYQKLEEEFQNVLKQVKVDTRENLILFISKPETGNSFTSDISNMLTYKNPEKLILIAWPYDGEFKCSLRSGKYTIPPMLTNALKGINGYGGGHDHACGACIKQQDFDKFVLNMKRELDKVNSDGE